MTYYTKDQIIKFLVESFWNYGVYFLVFILDTISKNLGGYSLDPFTLGMISILIARLTKRLNVAIQARQELK